MLGYLATLATSFTINLVSNLVWDKKIQEEERIKIQDIIQTQIGDFNRRYDNTVLDTYAFQKFLDSSDIRREIYERVFRTQTQSEGEPLGSFQVRIAREAIENVNNQYRDRGRAEVKDTDVFFKYFADLFAVLIEVRGNLLSLEHSAQTVILTEEIRGVRQAVIDQAYKEDNVFAEDRINEIDDLVSLWKFSEANKLISDALEAQQFLSTSQRELIYFEKARIILNTSKNRDELNNVVRKIKRINENSKYVAEINYLIACQEQDKKLLEDSLRIFEEYKYSTEKIALKKANFELASNNFNEVIEIIAPRGELLDEYQEYHEAHFYYGTVLIYNGSFAKALLELSLAFNQHRNIIYKYNAIVAKFNILLTKKNIIGASKEFETQVSELVNEFKKVRYITAYFCDEKKANYWNLLVTLISILNPKSALDELPNIDEELKNNSIIRSLKADVYLKNNMFPEAKKILDELGDLLPINIINLFVLLSEEKDWPGIVFKYNKLDGELKENPAILALYIKAKGKTESYDVIKTEIMKYANHEEVVVIKELLDITLRNKDENNFVKLINTLKQEKTSILDEELQVIIMLLNNHSKFEAIRTLIEGRIERNETLLQIYFQTFGILKKHNKLTHEVYEKLKSLYKNGCRFKVLLGYKAQIEMILEIPRKAIKTLEEYKGLFGADEFYAYNYVASNLAKKKYEGLDDEVNYLLNTKNAAFHLLVATLKANEGVWDEAQRIALSALYLSHEHLEKDILINYIHMYFSNTDKELKEINSEGVTVNCVVTLKSGDNIRKIAIHSNRAIIGNSGEYKFECENYGPDDSISLILTSLGKKGEIVKLEDGEYTVVDITYLYAYFFQFCLTQLEQVYPNHDYFIMNSAPTTEELLEQIKQTFKKLNKSRRTQLDMYNGSIEMGLPISFLSGKNINNYAEIIASLLNSENQHLYTGEVTLYEGREYVLSLSSIIIMALFGLTEKLEKIADKCIITTEVEKSIYEAIKEAQKQAKVSKGVMLLSEDNSLTGYSYNDEDKKNLKAFWTKILLTISKIKKIEATIDDNSMYEVFAMHLLDEDVSSIELSKKSNKVLVCDDLFVRRLHHGVTGTFDTTNCIGLIISEGVITYEEIIDLTIKLVKAKFLYPVSSQLLCDYMLWIMAFQDTERKVYFDKLKEIVKNMLDDISSPYYVEIRHDFLRAIQHLKIPPVFAYELFKEPLKLKPYTEFIHEKSREFIERILENPSE